MKAITLTDDQKKATNAFLDFLVDDDENFLVIQGAAGTGKSFLMRHLLETFYSKYKSYCLLLQRDVQEFDIKITATTNKAVAVVEEFLGDLANQHHIEICTIFSLLGLKVVNNKNNGRTELSFTNNSAFSSVKDEKWKPLVFIDEASFIGEELEGVIYTNLKERLDAKVVYIGDQYQLAPVGETRSVMSDIQCTKATLHQVMRNGNGILDTGTQFRKTVETGIFKPIPFNGTDVIHVDGPTFQKMVETSFLDRNWNTSVSKLLAWTNERVQEYNAHIRKAAHLPSMFASGETVITNEFIKGPKNFSRGVDSEVLITTVNQNETSMYGVRGHMIEIDRDYVGFMPNSLADKKRLLKSLAKEKNWPQYFEVKEQWLDLRAVYASSIHKAQGSTYDTVFLDLADVGKNWDANQVARLLYVGITRAAKQVVCYGYLPDRYC